MRIYKTVSLILVITLLGTITGCGKEKTTGFNPVAEYNKRMSSENSNNTYWFNRADFGESKENCELSIFNSDIKLPIELRDLDNYCDKYKYYVNGGRYEDVTDGNTSTIADVIKITNNIGGKSTKVYLNNTSEESPYKFGTMNICNFDEEPAPLNECIEKGWWKIGVDDSGIGANLSEEFGLGELYDNEDILNEAIEKLGRPDKLIADKDFYEEVANNDGAISYELVFDYNTYVITIMVIECIVNGNEKTDINALTYWTRECFDKSVDESSMIDFK